MTRLVAAAEILIGLVFPAAAWSATPASAVLSKYCVGCHNERLKTGGLTLEKADASAIPANAEVWEKVAWKLRTGAMPPPGLPRPDKDVYDSVAGQIETTLDRAAALNPDPGRTEALHRLNRNEYHNVIRDLLDLDIDVAALLPPDDSSFGFDNMAGVLRISPVLMERYTSAAQKISRIAVGSRDIVPVDDTIRAPSDLSQEDHIDGLPFGTRGGMKVPYTFPSDADYSFKVKLARNYTDSLSTFVEPHQIDVFIDGEAIARFTIGKQPKPGATPQEIRKMNDQDADAGFQVRVPVKAGPHEVSVAFVKKTGALVESPRSVFLRPALGPGGDTRLQPYIGSITVSGPFDVKGPGDTPSRRRIFTCRAAAKGGEEQCARSILSGLVRRAYRRPTTEADLRVLLPFYREGRTDGNFETGIELALRRLLVSPSFLFRIERDPAGVAAGASYPITELELASRLSFFLWSSIPDSELLDLAVHSKLKQPGVLEHQVHRMLADKRSNALVTNFAGQWLYLRNLPDKQPDSELFPDFDDGLRQSFRRETELFFSSFLHGDAPATELLTADYTFVNERLAQHYDIPNVYGSQFRRVTLSDHNRGGLLGQGGILLVTSYANRTSPVIRGKWLLDNLLGTPPPPPPPNVPSLKENSQGGKQLSVRERLEEHRANPACASCHKLMDPLGFALENFDAVGQWRSVSEAGTPIDASGVLGDGAKVDGPATLRQALLSRPENFLATLTQKLLAYSLGRGVEYYDMPSVRKIVHDAGGSNASLPSLIVNIVRSTPFQLRRSKSS